MPDETAPCIHCGSDVEWTGHDWICSTCDPIAGELLILKSVLDDMPPDKTVDAAVMSLRAEVGQLRNEVDRQKKMVVHGTCWCGATFELTADHADTCKHLDVDRDVMHGTWDVKINSTRRSSLGESEVKCWRYNDRGTR